MYARLCLHARYFARTAANSKGRGAVAGGGGPHTAVGSHFCMYCFTTFISKRTSFMGLGHDICVSSHPSYVKGQIVREKNDPP